MAKVEAGISKGDKEVDMIYIDDSLGKRLFDELIFLERLIRTIKPEAIDWEIIRSGIEKLLKEATRNGVVG